MIRSVGMLSCVCVLFFSASLAHARCLAPADPRIRMNNAALLDALATGVTFFESPGVQLI
jgi:hypothetical protein